jgi:ubiquitin-conjugating enzyme E2 Z
MNQIIKKETINRLLKDVKQIIQNPLCENGIYYLHDDTDLLKGYALIIGPEDTPYFGGNYFFEIKYPTDYPHSPPLVNYCTNGNNIRFNPNLYKCGKVCVSLLNTWRGEQWTSCQTISTVLLTLCTLLCKDPLLNEPGITKTHKDFDKYSEIIIYSNIDIAICNIVNKNKSNYYDFFELFHSEVKENFIKNYDKIVAIVENKKKTFENPTLYLTMVYNMKVCIDYEKLMEKLSDCKNSFV